MNCQQQCIVINQDYYIKKIIKKKKIRIQIFNITFTSLGGIIVSLHVTYLMKFSNETYCNCKTTLNSSYFFKGNAATWHFILF